MTIPFTKPDKQILVNATEVNGLSYWPEPINDEDTTWSGGSNPQYYQWKMAVSLINEQQHGYPYSTVPYRYSTLNIKANGYIVSVKNNRIYRVVSVESKTQNDAQLIVEDVYRFLRLTFQSTLNVGPTSFSQYVYFQVDDNFNALLDPFVLGSSMNARVFNFIEHYLEKIKFTSKPILCCTDNIEVGQIVAINDLGEYVKANNQMFDKIVGKVYMHTGITKEYVIEPINEYKSIDSTLGAVGDIIYLTDDGTTYTLEPTMKPMFLKVTESIPNVSISNKEVVNPKIVAGSKFYINEHYFEYATEMTPPAFIQDFNTRGLENFIAENMTPPYAIVNESNYTHGILGIMNLPCNIRINGQDVSITTTTSGQAQYNTAVAVGEDIAHDITTANLTDIIISFNPDTGRLTMTNTAGGDIIIENVSGDLFASDTGNSGTGFKETNINTSTQMLVKITNTYGKEILIREIAGNLSSNSGINSADNGSLPKGIYYGGKVRKGSNYVIDNLTQLNTITPYIGDAVHILDSGNGEWVEKKYTKSGWVTIATEDSARTDADILSLTVNHEMVGDHYIGTVSSNSRVSDIAIVVTEAFNDDTIMINVGDTINNSALISDDYVDLLNTATYGNSPSNVYDVETDLYVFISDHLSTTGEFKIVISYQ